MFTTPFERIQIKALERLQGLSPDLTYHCLDHTLDILYQSVRIAITEGIKEEKDLYLLKIAAMYHDTGFLRTYANHEVVSCQIFLEDAIKYDLSELDKKQVENLIMATKIPQQPHNLLERIICDADLDYLGRDDFFTIGDGLRREFLHYGIVSDDDQWEALQFRFLENHHYHTPSSQKLRAPKKEENYQILLSRKTA